MVRNFIPSDKGKDVIDADGDRIGRVVHVEEETAYIEPVPSMTTRIRRRLGWDAGEKETFPIIQDRVQSIEGDKIYLQE